jgi:hypothetical protein
VKPGPLGGILFFGMKRTPWLILLSLFPGLGALVLAAQDPLLAIDEQINAHLECGRLCRERNLEGAHCGCSSLTSVAQRRLRDLEKGGALALECRQASRAEPTHQQAEQEALNRVNQLWARIGALRAKSGDAAGIPSANVEKFRREVDAIASRHPLEGERVKMRRHLIGRERELKQASKRFKVFPSQRLYGELLQSLTELRRESYWMMELSAACGKLPVAALFPGSKRGPDRQI